MVPWWNRHTLSRLTILSTPFIIAWFLESRKSFMISVFMISRAKPGVLRALNKCRRTDDTNVSKVNSPSCCSASSQLPCGPQGIVQKGS